MLAGALGSFMTITGVTHFTRPAYYRRLIPDWLPAPSRVVAASGVLDCAVGLLMLNPRTRRLGGWSTAAVITTYLPAHLDALRTRGQPTFLDRPAGVTLRVLANLGYIAAATSVGLSGQRSRRGQERQHRTVHRSPLLRRAAAPALRPAAGLAGAHRPSRS